MEVTTILREPKSVVEGDKVEETNQNLLNTELELSSIMVQVLRRGSDPITPGLEQCLHAWVNAGMAYQPAIDTFGGWIDVARNWQTKMFNKAPRFKWLLMVDSDVTPPIDAPILLARHDKPVVSACVAGYNSERGLFLCVAVKGPDGKARFPTLNKTKLLPARGLVKVHNAGTGCLLVRRDVIEALWAKHEAEVEQNAAARAALLTILKGDPIDESAKQALWAHVKTFDPVLDLSGPPFNIPQSVRNRAAEIGAMPKGEDIVFTDRVRAAGFDIYADFEVQCGHDKVMRLQWPKDRLDPDLAVSDWMSSVYDAPVVQE